MPERWRAELDRLRNVHPSNDLWERVGTEAAHGSSDPARPPNRQRVVAGVVAFAVFGAAGLFAWRILRPTDPTGIGGTTLATSRSDLAVTLTAPTQPSTENDIHLPTATFRLGDQERDIHTQGVTGWPGIPDDLSFTAELQWLFEVPAGTRLVIAGDATSASATVRSGVSIDSTTEPLDLSDGSATLPSEVDQYVMELTGIWPDGAATFTVSFQIAPTTAAAVFRFDEQDPQAPQLSLVVGGGAYWATLGTHSWTFDNGSGSADAVMPTFTDADAVRVQRGTPLILQDAPPDLQMSANEGLTPNYGPPVGTPLQLDLTAPGWNFDLPPGSYLVVVDARWDDAQAQFWLPIQIVEAGSASPTQPVPSVVSPGVSETRISPALWHLLVAYGSVWITGDNGVTRVNSSTGEVEAEIAVAHADESDITAGAGHVWVTAGASIVGIDATTNEIDRHFEIQTGIREIDFANDRIYYGHSAEGNGDLSEIDPLTGAFGGSILTGGPGLAESGIPHSGGAFWVSYSSPASSGSTSGLVRVEQDLSRADPVAGVANVFSIAEAGGSIWAVGTDVLYKVDADGTLVDSFPIALAGKVASDGDRLWLLMNTGSTSGSIYLPDPDVPARVVEVDPESGALLGDGTPLPHDVPANIAVGDGMVWVSFYDAGVLSAIDVG